MKKYTWFTFLLFFSIASAQTDKKVDSLLHVIETIKDNEAISKAYDDLIDFYLDTDSNKALSAINAYQKLNQKGACSRCETMSLFYRAHWFARRGDLSKSIEYFEKSADYAIKHNDLFQYQRSKAWKVQIQIDANQLDTAEKELNLYFEKTKDQPDKTGWDEMYFLKALLNYNRGYLKLAIDNYIKADKIIVDNGWKKSKMRIGILNNIAQVYRELKNYKKTKYYVGQAYDEAIKIKDTFLIMNVTQHKGIIETDFKNLKAAIPFLKSSYDYFDGIKYEIYKGSSALYIGMVYHQLNDYKLAENYLTLSKATYVGLQDDNSLAQTLAWTAMNKAALNDIIAAQNAIEQAKKLMSKNKNSPIYLEILEAEINVYESNKQYEKVLNAIKERDKYREQLNKKQNENQLNELEIIYQANKKEQELQLLSQKSKVQNSIYLSILGLLVALGSFLFFAYRNKIKTAKKLNDLNELKSRFFANISHEFRTPLTLIKSPLQSLKSDVSSENQKNKLELIEQNSDRMLELVNQLLELSKIDSGKLQLLLKEVHPEAWFNTLCEPFIFKANELKIQFSKNNTTGTEKITIDTDVVAKIVSNLLTNALKYTPANATIRFEASREKEQLHLVVANSGTTLTKEEIPSLFERFYQKKSNNPGFGIGLALVQELVQLYKGELNTTLENGTLSFKVALPLHPKNAIISATNNTTQVARLETITHDDDTPVVLVVDDNPDIRLVLRDIFEKKFKILEAENGKTALKLAQKEIPDCIISDIMMPEMDGITFTKEIKNNELTSFIPVLILTAKTSDEAKIEALKNTADAYLTKPFNNAVVTATVNQLIAERKKLHDRYSQELILKPVDIVINSHDEKFLEKLQRVLEKEIANSEFSAEDFADALGMSRMQLHRKLKSLLGVSATEFMRTERLKTAAGLLKKGGINIAEIAYTVGFNDVSYFNRCFKEQFLCSPKEYIEKRN